MRINLSNADGNGHRIHCEYAYTKLLITGGGLTKECRGTIGGSQYGAAMVVNIIAVKVLSDGG
jgi:hypothetical protein